MVLTTKEIITLFNFGILFGVALSLLLHTIIYIYYSYQEYKENKQKLNYLNELLLKVTNNTAPSVIDAYNINAYLAGYEYDEANHNKVVKDILLALFCQPTYLEKVKKVLINDINKLTGGKEVCRKK